MSAPRFPRFNRVHFVGIGGIGMSGIAEVLINLGHAVTGSDLSEGAATRRLRACGARIARGHDAANVEGADVVVVSSAIRSDNVEVQRARELGIPVIPRAEMLAELMRLKHGIAIAGSHGKTTTTSLAAAVVAAGGLDPTVVVGGRVAQLGSTARLGRGDFLVCEADESDGSFLKLSPTLAVVTNVDAEHLETYDGSVDTLCGAFLDFCNAVPFYGAAILCLDDANVQGFLPRVTRRVVTYGTSEQADLSLRNLSFSSGVMEYTATHQGVELGRVSLRQPGRHVALNSLAALAVGLELSIPFETARDALAAFEGVDRRMTVKGVVGGVHVVDDYAHHPTEIVATLEALRDGWRCERLVAIFQPHRYSRVAALHDDFCCAFNRADVVLTCDIHAAGEEPIAGVTGERLAEGLREHGHRGVEHVGTPAAAAKRAAELARPGDLVVTLGAGDVWKAADALLEALASRGGAGGSSEAPSAEVAS